MTAAPHDALLVVAADKLHNATCTLADVRAEGAIAKARFKGGRDGKIWHYEQMHAVLADRLGTCFLLSRLGTVLTELALANSR